MRSYRHYLARHIHGLAYLNISDIYGDFKTKYNPSWDASSDTQYEMFVVVDRDNVNPIGPYYTCVAGLGEVCTC